ncbi:replication protein [Bacillus sp. S/N-304-OC-R1]|uniref:replication protein n=1 Tax=Bacillus sp. S/N-304-OC-R1 TaxID=2758034 RepID=UPI001C8E1FF1|nr:replication protein [Bacillus sp. S/N-304-OC-R1]MBY0124492.1 replication protein [Bacillus sp. S/N-304-OC-R1]
MSGFTKVYNRILEEVSSRKFNASQLSVLMIVWRMTYGFNREDHELAVNYFVQATGFSKRNIQDTVNSLIEGKVLKETQQASFNQTRKIAFNKNTDEWLFESRTTLPQVKDCSPHEEEFTSPDEQKFTSPGEESFTHKRKIKEISKEKDDQMDKPIPEALYEKTFGFPTAVLISDFKYWIEESQFQEPEAIICEVIKRATLEKPKFPAKYIQKSVQRLLELGLFTLEAVKNYNSKFDQKVKKKKSPQDISLERPSHWVEPEPLTKDEFCRMKELEEELPY